MGTINQLAEKDRYSVILFNERFGYDIPKARNFVLAKAKPLTGPILEIGTGRGHMTVVLAKEGLKLVSIDLDSKYRDVARANLEAFQLENLVKMEIMDAERLRFPDASFDAVISADFLHRARNPLKCVEEMVRVSGKKLVFSDLNENGVRIMDKIHAERGQQITTALTSFDTLETYLEKRGFIIKSYRNEFENVLVAERISCPAGDGNSPD